MIGWLANIATESTGTPARRRSIHIFALSGVIFNLCSIGLFTTSTDALTSWLSTSDILILPNTSVTPLKEYTNALGSKPSKFMLKSLFSLFGSFICMSAFNSNPAI